MEHLTRTEVAALGVILGSLNSDTARAGLLRMFIEDHDPVSGTPETPSGEWEVTANWKNGDPNDAPAKPKKRNLLGKRKSLRPPYRTYKNLSKDLRGSELKRHLVRARFFKNARLNAGLGKSELATKMGVSNATIDQWEYGIRAIPDARFKEVKKITKR